MTSPQSVSAVHTPGTGIEHLAFTLGQEEYALNILQVQEIRSFEPVTAIAGAPAYLKGLLHLRGAIVPVVDLRVKLGIGQPTFDAMTAVIITHLGGKTAGFVVDRVNDVVALGAEHLHPMPDFDAQTTDHISGLAVIDERTLILVDAEKLFEQ